MVDAIFLLACFVAVFSLSALAEFQIDCFGAGTTSVWDIWVGVKQYPFPFLLYFIDKLESGDIFLLEYA